MINKDEAAGKMDKGKGTIKEKVGEWTGDAEMESEGVADQAAGTVREKTGTATRKTEETVDDLKKNLNR